MPRRRLSIRERRIVYRVADGFCESCGKELELGWHADHVVPFSKGGSTDVVNSQALCPACNLMKGVSMAKRRPSLKGLLRKKMRAWQQEALTKLIRAVERGATSWLLEATPGAGKTRFTGEAIRALEPTYVIIVVPWTSMKRHWVENLANLNIQITDNIDRDPVRSHFHKKFIGYVTTYQAIAADPREFKSHVARVARSGGDVHVILDEVHHCSSRTAWGTAAREAFENADLVLGLTGTPFRSDRRTMPFFDYDDDGVVKIDHSYRYRAALSDNVVLPVSFHELYIRSTWLEEGSEEKTARVGDEHLTNAEASRLLRDALDTDGDGIEEVLADADGQLTRMRKIDHMSAGLIICIDINHAKEVAEILELYSQDYDLIVSSGQESDKKASEVYEAIERFKKNDKRWLICVRMVSEGVDIPRLKLLVYLTNITTALFWHQAIGRIVRPGPMLGSDDSAVVYYPADPRLTALAEDITSDLNDYYNADLEDLEEQARDEGFGEPRELLPISTDDSGRVILSTKLEEVAGNDPDGRPYDQQAYDEACRIVEATGHSGDEHILAATIYALDGNIPPRPTEDEETSPIKDSYDRLRSKNNQIVKQIAYHLSEEHPLVNARLNKLVGVRSIEDADLKQLTERIRLAQQWLTTRKQPRG